MSVNIAETFEYKPELKSDILSTLHKADISIYVGVFHWLQNYHLHPALWRLSLVRFHHSKLLFTSFLNTKRIELLFAFQ